MASNRGVAYIEYSEVQAQHGVILKTTPTDVGCGRTTAPSGFVLGREVAGEVVEAGRGVPYIHKDNIVSVPFDLGSGRCWLERKPDLSGIRTVIGALLLSVAFSATALAGEPAIPRASPDEQDLQVSSPLAQDIDGQLDAGRGIENELSLEQSQVNARSTSGIQREQTARDIQLSRERLDTLETEAPQTRSIPLLENELDQVSRPTGAISRDPGLESGAPTSLGLSGSIDGR
jgi:hypothetical protein